MEKSAGLGAWAVALALFVTPHVHCVRPW